MLGCFRFQDRFQRGRLYSFVKLINVFRIWNFETLNDVCEIIIDCFSNFTVVSYRFTIVFDDFVLSKNSGLIVFENLLLSETSFTSKFL